MDHLVYLVYILLPVLLLWKSKCYGRGQWNEGFLSLQQSKALQGFLALLIMFHHVSQKTCASWIQPKSRIQHGLGIFVDAGFLLVAVFMFFNGYGVYKSLHTKKDYLKGFLKKRILPIILALYSTTLIYFIARLLVGEKMDGMQIFFYLTSIQLCNPYVWYVIVLPFFYLFFYLAFRFIKQDGLAVLLVFLLVLAYMLIGTAIPHNNYLIRGEWWYNCVHLFPIGILFAKYEDTIIPHLKRHYVLYLLLAFGLYFFDHLLQSYVLGKYSYYAEFLPDGIFRKRVSLASQMLLTTHFVFCVLLLWMKVEIGNRFLAMMGKLTLEFYLIHGLFVELCDHTFDGGVRSPFPIHNLLLYLAVVFAFGLPSAILLQKFHHWILRRPGR